MSALEDAKLAGTEEDVAAGGLGIGLLGVT